MIIQTAKPTCYRAHSLPHALDGQITIGTIEPNQTVNVEFMGYALAARKLYQGVSDGAGELIITIPENDRFWFTMWEDCGYKIRVLNDELDPIAFTVSETETECVIVNLQENCGLTAPYSLSLMPIDETDNSCNVCQ